jgi:cell division protein FtsZ
VTSAADPNANIIFGAVIDEAMGEEVRVTVIATGFGAQRRRRRGSAEAPVSVPSGAPSSGSSEQGEDGLDVPSFLRNE